MIQESLIKYLLYLIYRTEEQNNAATLLAFHIYEEKKYI